MTIRLIVILCLSFGLAPSALANPSDTFRVANEAIRAGSVEDGIHLLETLKSQGYQSVDLFYNLGTAYAMKSEWKDARLNLERARRLKPSAPSIQANLEHVRSEIGDFYEFPKYPLYRVVEWIRTHLGLQFTSIFFLVLISSLVGLITSIKVFDKNKLRRPLFTVGVLLLLFAPVLSMDFIYEQEADCMYLVKSDQEELLQIPELNAASVEILKGGTKLKMQEILGDWIQVTTSTGLEGWLPLEKIEKIT